jgi:transposase
VIDMAFLSVIRRWALRDKLSIREIARRTGLSRNTIRKYLRSGDVAPQFSIPARRQGPAGQPALHGDGQPLRL